jgi:hypothetical protein
LAVCRCSCAPKSEVWVKIPGLPFQKNERQKIVGKKKVKEDREGASLSINGRGIEQIRCRLLPEVVFGIIIIGKVKSMDKFLCFSSDFESNWWKFLDNLSVFRNIYGILALGCCF